MFWDASYTPSPKIEALLNQENITLAELLDDEEIISECKSQNSKLVQYLNRPDILEELITLITTVPPADVGDAIRFKHSNTACEILTSDLQSINRSIVCEEKVLLRLYAFLEQEAPLNPLLLSFFSKVFGMLWAQKQKQDWFTYQFVCVTLLEFLKGRGNFLDHVLRHVYSPVMLDLVYHMVTHIEGPDIRKTLYDWLVEQRLVEKLLAILGEGGADAAEKHMNVAQFVVEYLSMGRAKRQSEKQEGATADPILDQLEDRATIQLLLERMVAEGAAAESVSPSAIVAGTRIILALFDDNLINDNTDDPALQYLVNAEKEHHEAVVACLIDVLKGYVQKFHELLLVEPPPLTSSTASTTLTVDSGFSNETIVVSTTESTPEKCLQETERKAEEDSSAASDSSAPSPAALSPEREATPATVVPSRRHNNHFAGAGAFGNTRLQICCLFTVLLETENRDIINAICASELFGTLLSLFKQYSWNNFLHGQVKKCLCYAIGAFDEQRDEAADSVRLAVSPLQRHLIVDCRLATVLYECWHANEVEVTERNGVRLGYMGHLIAVLEVLQTNCKVSEELRALVEGTLQATQGVATLAAWQALVGEGGTLDAELGNQNRFLADCNPARMNDAKEFFIEATDSFQDLESTALSENLDNFLSRYISSDLNSHFFNTVNGWSEDNLDEFEGLADKNWSKFDGDDDDEVEASTSALNFVRPWDGDVAGEAGDDEKARSAGGSTGDGNVAQQDSGWANFSSANFADFDTHFNEFAIGTFDGAKAAEVAPSGPSAAEGTKELACDVDIGAEGDVEGAVVERCDAGVKLSPNVDEEEKGTPIAAKESGPVEEVGTAAAAAAAAAPMDQLAQQLTSCCVSGDEEASQGEVIGEELSH